jgi:hypothetical protein
MTPVWFLDLKFLAKLAANPQELQIHHTSEDVRFGALAASP